ncbi:cytochrome b [Methylocella sp.]|uniref:cytochrome b n=1 Tax=Methylocella sp. TaxID=1978226 RepID=UPI003783F025
MTTASTFAQPQRTRYDGVSQTLHWLTALLVLAALVFAWVGEALPRTSDWKGYVFMVHKSLGVTILAATLFRLVWRGLNPPPPAPWSFEPWEVWAGKITHALLYLMLLVMPVSGYVLSAAKGRTVDYFNLVSLPALAENKPLADAATSVHLAAQFAVYVLIVAHLCGVVWHVVARRDGTLGRMLPPQTDAD